MSSSTLPYRRVLLKISGEAFCASGGHGIDVASVEAVVAELVPVLKLGVQIALVVGGGNLLRGKTFSQGDYISRPVADAMGMLATVMNGIALQDALEHHGIAARALSAVPVGAVCEPFVRSHAVSLLNEGRVVILTGGTGNPFFTTDTCAALRASELQADVLFKATKVDGVFEADPVTNPSARKFERLDYGEVLKRQLGVMDLAAVSLCMESRIPVIVFRLATPGNLLRAIQGEAVGTIIAAR
jgi:uridylate kinase